VIVEIHKERGYPKPGKLFALSPIEHELQHRSPASAPVAFVRYIRTHKKGHQKRVYAKDN
jgi:hypothetical protein